MRKAALALAGAGVGALVIASLLAWPAGPTARSRETARQARFGEGAGESAPARPRPASSAGRPDAAPLVVGPESPPASGDEETSEAPGAEEVLAVRAARRAADGAGALASALGSRDPVAVAEAADGLVAKGSREALAALLAADVPSSAAPLAVIDAVGKMARTFPSEASAIVAHLARVLSQVKRDPTDRDARALQVYEALGDTESADATPILAGELTDPSVRPAAKVRILTELSRLPRLPPREALLAVREGIGAPPADPLDAEIERELAVSLDGLLER